MPILCGSNDAADSIEALNAVLGRIELGGLASLRTLGDLDVNVEFDSGIAVDFLATISDGDECFHIFCPDKVYVEFSVSGGWKIGKSDIPWSGEDQLCTGL